jgi:hypothetical protein
MKHTTYLLSLLICSMLLTAASCGRKTRTVQTKLDTYEEDLSEYRPLYDEGPIVENPEKRELEVELRPTHHVNEDLHTALDSIALYNAGTNYVEGYRLQVYLGKSREKALEVRDLLFQILPDERPEVLYDQPNYKVKVGKYTERMEAQKAYMKIQEEFPNAIVIPEKLWVEK